MCIGILMMQVDVLYLSLVQYMIAPWNQLYPTHLSTISSDSEYTTSLRCNISESIQKVLQILSVLYSLLKVAHSLMTFCI